MSIMTNFDYFVEVLYQTFGIQDKKRKAEHKINLLTQTGSDHEHAISHYFDRLKKEVQEELYKEDRPASIHDFITMAIRIDDRQYQWRTRKQRTNYYTNTGKPRQQRPAVSGTYTGPMELGAMEKRKCYNCNKIGHISPQCPRPKKQKNWKPAKEGKKQLGATGKTETKTLGMVRKTTQETNPTTTVVPVFSRTPTAAFTKILEPGQHWDQSVSRERQQQISQIFRDLKRRYEQGENILELGPLTRYEYMFCYANSLIPKTSEEREQATARRNIDNRSEDPRAIEAGSFIHILTEIEIEGNRLTAFVDCGAQENYISPAVINRLRLPWRKKKETYTVANVEGSKFEYNNGIVDSETDHLTTKIQGKKFDITYDLNKESDAWHEYARAEHSKEEERLKNIPDEYRIYDKLFKETLETGLPEHNQWDHEISIIEGGEPAFHKLYNLTEPQLQTLREYIDDILAKGYIRLSTLSAGYPVIFVPKKNGKLRLVGKRWFTALDLKGAYNLIRIKEGDKWKTAFRTKFGLYEYLIIPFGLTNAPVTFQRIINQVLREYLNIFIVVYLNDILIFSDDLETHKEHVHKVLKKLEDAKLLVEPEKSYFHVQEVNFLGHTIRPNEIRIEQGKIAAVKDWETPKTVKEDYGKIAVPLYDITKKGIEFQWDDKQQEAFNEIKNRILSEPVLRMFDPIKEVELETDASDFAISVQLSQKDDNGVLHPVAFFSKKLHGAELNYPIYNKEFMAIMRIFEEFEHYCLGMIHKVKVYTDHKNIQYFATTQQLNRRQIRYAEYLSQFDYEIIHRKGSENGRADALSRKPEYEQAVPKINRQLLTTNDKGHLVQKALGATLKETAYAKVQIDTIPSLEKLQ
uniref:RNA-directed DNA polymerase n=1 Tax=Bionectria ochroleuca TaxID=29856 RepID=A0A8H7N3U5_BIOOC